MTWSTSPICWNSVVASPLYLNFFKSSVAWHKAQHQNLHPFFILQTKKAVYIFSKQQHWTQMYAKDVKLKVLHALKVLDEESMKLLKTGSKCTTANLSYETVL